MANRIEWHTDVHSPYDIIEKFPDKKGIIIKVVEGYCGDEPWECLSTGELWLIHSCRSHYRAVITDKFGRYLSIPLKYPVKFTPASTKHVKKNARKDAAGQSLEDLLVKYPPPILVKMMPEDRESGRPCLEFMVKATYKERYLVANRITSDGLDNYTTVVPAYIRARLVFAKFSAINARYAELAKSMNLPGKLNSSGILLYSSREVEEKTKYGDVKAEEESPIKPENIYEALEPKHMVSHLYKSIDRETHVGQESDTLVTGSPPDLPPRSTQIYWDITSSEQPQRTRPEIQGPRTTSHTLPGYDTVRGAANTEASPSISTSNLVIREVRDIPPDIKSLNQVQVGQCLKLLNMERYITQFNDNQINGSVLVTLDDIILVEDLSLSRLDAKRLIMFCKGWRPDN